VEALRPLVKPEGTKWGSGNYELLTKSIEKLMSDH
jgi:hypothetical protein